MQSWVAPPVPRLPGRGPDPRLHDTATGEVRALSPGPTATMYVCGITPYDATHLGHAETYLTFDLLNRVLRDAGHEVRYVQNVTDVDDPLLERAQRNGVDWRELAAQEIERFRGDMTALRVLPPADFVGAVEAIPQIADMVVRLRRRGAAYEVGPDDCRDVYFDVAAAPRIGHVAHLAHAEMVQLSHARGGDPDRPGKRDPIDPLLWRAERPGEPAWDSPVGRGRPGWHVECAAIALERIGPTIDVQGGGTDLIFPHHELGAAHAEVDTGIWPFARHYVHVALVAYEGHKMSKSRGNLVFVSRLRESGADPMAIRLALLAQSWRTAWEWTPGLLERAGGRLQRWREAVRLPAGPPADRVLGEVRARLADDLDAPRALAALDAWAEDALVRGGRDPVAPALVRDAADALLGVALAE